MDGIWAYACLGFQWATAPSKFKYVCMGIPIVGLPLCSSEFFTFLSNFFLPFI